MPCALLLVILFFPRITLACMWLFTTYLDRAFHGEVLAPLAGFIFLPLTTIVYAWERNNSMPAEGLNLVWLVLAVIVDLWGWGGGAKQRAKR